MAHSESEQRKAVIAQKRKITSILRALRADFQDMLALYEPDIEIMWKTGVVLQFTKVQLEHMEDMTKRRLKLLEILQTRPSKHYYLFRDYLKEYQPELHEIVVDEEQKQGLEQYEKLLKKPGQSRRSGAELWGIARRRLRDYTGTPQKGQPESAKVRWGKLLEDLGVTQEMEHLQQRADDTDSHHISMTNRPDLIPAPEYCSDSSRASTPVPGHRSAPELWKIMKKRLRYYRDDGHLNRSPELLWAITLENMKNMHAPVDLEHNENYGPEYQEQASETDMADVGRELSPSDLQHFYTELKIDYRDVERCEKKANTHDDVLKAKVVLLHWRQANGQKATREALLMALKWRGFITAKETLEKMWKRKKEMVKDRLGRTSRSADELWRILKKRLRYYGQPTPNNHPELPSLKRDVHMGEQNEATEANGSSDTKTDDEVFVEKQPPNDSKAVAELTDEDMGRAATFIGPLKEGKKASVYKNLGISPTDRRSAEMGAKDESPIKKSMSVLSKWRDTEGGSRVQLYSALKQSGLGAQAIAFKPP